jgi:hypothetical protein
MIVTKTPVRHQLPDNAQLPAAGALRLRDRDQVRDGAGSSKAQNDEPVRPKPAVECLASRELQVRLPYDLRRLDKRESATPVRKCSTRPAQPRRRRSLWMTGALDEELNGYGPPRTRSGSHVRITQIPRSKRSPTWGERVMVHMSFFGSI